MSYEFEETDDKEWFRRRITIVLESYNAFNALNENGQELEDPSTSVQIPCPFHNDTRPSARYYSGSKASESHFYCFKCKLKLNGIALYARYRGTTFSEALRDLERRFQIKIPKKPDSVDFQIPVDKSSSTYKSEAWGDVERMMKLIESKLSRIRDIASYTDYVKFCKLLDQIDWDLRKTNGVATSQMAASLLLAKQRIDDLVNLNAELL